MTREHDRRATVAILAMTLIFVGASVLAFSTSTDDTAVADAAAPSGPEFVVECTWSHRASDDPIVHPGHAGASHVHDFFGTTETSALSTADSLVGTPTSCQTHAADTAAYWAPTLYLHDEAIEPGRLFAYYRRPTGVDPEIIQPFPFGLALVAGDAAATEPQPTSVVAWHCGASPELSWRPIACPPTAPLTLRVVFPSCWDGIQLDSDDHQSHLAYVGVRGCPPSHSVVLPELVLDLSYAFAGDPSGLRLASGDVLTAHADFLNAWDPGVLAETVDACLWHGQRCGPAPTRSVD